MEYQSPFHSQKHQKQLPHANLGWIQLKTPAFSLLLRKLATELTKIMRYSIYFSKPHTQNQRTAEVRRMDLWRSSGANPLIKHGHLEQAAEDHQLLNIFSNRHSTTTLSNVCQCSVILTIKTKQTNKQPTNHPTNKNPKQQQQPVS